MNFVSHLKLGSSQLTFDVTIHTISICSQHGFKPAASQPREYRAHLTAFGFLPHTRLNEIPLSSSGRLPFADSRTGRLGVRSPRRHAPRFRRPLRSHKLPLAETPDSTRPPSISSDRCRCKVRFPSFFFGVFDGNGMQEAYITTAFVS